MTPKYKAKELFEKMDVVHYIKLGGKNKDSKGLPVSMYDSQIKQCALIAVDEIIQAMDNVMLPNPFKQYWNKVKQEIEKYENIK